LSIIDGLLKPAGKIGFNPLGLNAGLFLELWQKNLFEHILSRIRITPKRDLPASVVEGVPPQPGMNRAIAVPPANSVSLE
jgi:hypothetical protein